jgi:hypothetical protein
MEYFSTSIPAGTKVCTMTTRTTTAGIGLSVLIDENGVEHKHKFVQDLPIDKSPATTSFRRRRVVDVAAVTDVVEAKKLLALGWEYKTSYPATIANIPHYIMVKRE